VNELKENAYRDTLLRVLAESCGILFTCLFIDRINRKTFLATSLFLSGILIILIGFNNSPSWVTSFFLLQSFFGAAPSSLIYLYTPEVNKI
jgi:sugar phosphate permease